MRGSGTDIDFRQIVPRLGSKADAFEELCCQLARRVAGSSLQRLHGAGGDGGIECYVDEATHRTRCVGGGIRLDKAQNQHTLG